MEILTLGAGKIGSCIAVELSKICRVTCVDTSVKSLDRVRKLNKNIKTVVADGSNLSQDFLNPFSLVISAVPGFLGYETLKNLINSEKNIIDLSFMPENSLNLQSFALAKGVTAIVDAGLAPGLTNLLSGHLAAKGQTDTIKIFVGGLPKHRKWPFQYKAPFSFVDVIEEYTRPARIKLYNNIVNKTPMSSAEIIDTEIGSLEGFYTDGVRTMLFSLSEVQTIIEKTLRYPGYSEYINVLKSSGFFDKEFIEVNGQKIMPFEFTSKILDKEFCFNSDEHDIVVMQVIGEGKENNKFELIDEYCTETRISAMARTTGYTACACANLVINEKWQHPGINLLENIGKDSKAFSSIINYLSQRRIVIKGLIK